MLNAHLLFTRRCIRRPLSVARESRALAVVAGGPGDRPPFRRDLHWRPGCIIAAAKRWESIGVDQINFC